MNIEKDSLLFDLYIHTNLKNDVPAKVGKYTFIKYNENLNVYIKYLEDCKELCKNNLNSFWRDKNKLQLDINTSQSFFIVRFLCCEEHKKNNRKKRWILVIDPDVFCYKSLINLNKYIRKAEENNIYILARKFRTGYNSSFMLIDTHHINWTENSMIDYIFNKKDNFQKYMRLQFENVAELPRDYNEYDQINKNTICYHTTKTTTQPWKTGIYYKKCDLNNCLKVKNQKKTEIFKEHPNKFLKKILYNEFKNAYNNNFITDKDINNGIKIEGLRPDIKKICDM